MVQKKRDWGVILESQRTICPTCGRVIEPAEIRRVAFEEMVRP